MTTPAACDAGHDDDLRRQRPADLGHRRRGEHHHRPSTTPLGRQTATIDALGHRTTFVYDVRGQLVETDFPDGTKTTTTYDAAGHRIASTDQAGRTTQFVYDALGRLVATIEPDARPAPTTTRTRPSTTPPAR